MIPFVEGVHLAHVITSYDSKTLRCQSQSWSPRSLDQNHIRGCSVWLAKRPRYAPSLGSPPRKPSKRARHLEGDRGHMMTRHHIDTVTSASLVPPTVRGQSFSGRRGPLHVPTAAKQCDSPRLETRFAGTSCGLHCVHPYNACSRSPDMKSIEREGPLLRFGAKPRPRNVCQSSAQLSRHPVHHLHSA